jgi:hypothetical protein
MVKLEYFDPTERQASVIEKYGEQILEKCINNAIFTFFTDIHNQFIGVNKPDNSDDDISWHFVEATLDYIYDNDEELQKEYDDYE